MKRLLLALSLVCLACAEPATESSSAAHASIPPTPAASPLGEGFAVWESNRSGAWRIWWKGLTSETARQLTTDEPPRQHCCPHLSPNGTRLAYMSLAPGEETYPQDGAEGTLRVRDLSTGEEQVVAKVARTYFEHRAVVWRDDNSLIYIDGGGITTLANVDTGARRVLIREPAPVHGWLVDPTLSWATPGLPTFSPYDATNQSVSTRQRRGGCQPYFSHDGRFGYWIAGAGGPVDRIELATGEVTTLLAKSDSRLPADQGYIYFPMVSRDGRALAVAASPDQHDHMRSNYDVFIGPTDPATLELLAPMIRITDHPATDRFPDLHLEPLPLGRHVGEAPLTVALEAPGKGWTWSDGTTGNTTEITFTEPGAWAISAQRGDEERRGLALIRPKAAPTPLRATMASPNEIIVTFDEPVQADGKATLDNGPRVTAIEAGPSASSLRLQLAQPLEADTSLTLEQIADRAEPANLLARATLDIRPTAWPSNPNGLILLWEDGASDNTFTHDGQNVASVFVPHGRAWYDRLHSMVLRGGYFLGDMATMERLLHGAQATNELTFSMVVTPTTLDQSAPIFTFSAGANAQRNLTLEQLDDQIVLRLRTATTGQWANQPSVPLGTLRAGTPMQVTVIYRAGQLQAVIDGKKRLESDAIQDGFFHWTPRPLLVGGEWQGAAWQGTVRNLAIWNRAQTIDEATTDYRQLRAALLRRPSAPRRTVNATLIARSDLPTLQQIAPYREALAVFEWQADGQTLRIAHRVLHDAQPLAPASWQIGTTHSLTLEPFTTQPQLQELYLSDTLERKWDIELDYGLE
ncbi:MAG: LamG-like jellyroll fold domain-containing protein [Acidobacteriota bacterium]